MDPDLGVLLRPGRQRVDQHLVRGVRGRRYEAPASRRGSPTGSRCVRPATGRRAVPPRRRRTRPLVVARPAGQARDHRPGFVHSGRPWVSIVRCTSTGTVERCATCCANRSGQRARIARGRRRADSPRTERSTEYVGGSPATSFRSRPTCRDGRSTPATRRSPAPGRDAPGPAGRPCTMTKRDDPSGRLLGCDVDGGQARRGAVNPDNHRTDGLDRHGASPSLLPSLPPAGRRRQGRPARPDPGRSTRLRPSTGRWTRPDRAVGPGPPSVTVLVLMWR
jgi:hypothetical protein